VGVRHFLGLWVLLYSWLGGDARLGGAEGE